MQNFLREDRHKCDGAAEQNGKEIERDGSEENLCIPHVVNAGENDLSRDSAMFHASGTHMQREDEHEEGDQRDQGEEEDDAGPAEAIMQRQRIQNAAE